MHVLDVEEIPVATPHLVEDLCPLLLRNHPALQVGGGDLLGRVLAVRRHIVELESRAVPDQGLRAVRRQSVALDVLGQRLGLTILEGEDLELGLDVRTPTVVERPASRVQDEAFAGVQVAVVVRFHRDAGNPAAQAFEVDPDIGLLYLGFFFCLLFILVLFKRDLVAFRGQGVRHIVS